LLAQTLNLWIFPFYASETGERILDPAAVGVALSIGRIVNGLVDPFIAFASDRLRSPGGRRRPFVFAAAPLLGIAFALLWQPPPANAFLYLTIALSVYYALISTVMNPYLALLPEIASGPQGRIAAGAWQAVGNLAGTAFVAVGSGWLGLRLGFGTMGAILAAIAVGLLYVAVSPFRERPAPPSLGGAPLWSTALTLLRTRKLRAYLGGMTLAWIGLGMVILVLAFFVSVTMGLPRVSVGHVLGVALAVTLACFPIVTALARRYGAFAALVSALSLGCILLPLMAAIGRLPFLTPVQQGYLFIGLSGIPIAALYALPNALLADIAAENAERSGSRQEAMHYALQGVLLNLASAIAAAAVGGLLRIGYGPENDIGLRLVPLCGAVFIALALVAFRRLGPTGGRRIRVHQTEGGQTSAG